MNEYILYTLAQVATSLAGFSGLVVVFSRARNSCLVLRGIADFLVSSWR